MSETWAERPVTPILLVVLILDSMRCSLGRVGEALGMVDERFFRPIHAWAGDFRLKTLSDSMLRL
jgi:hypothetical protein